MLPLLYLQWMFFWLILFKSLGLLDNFNWKICIKLVKSNSECIYIVAKLILNILIEESWKTKILTEITVSKIYQATQLFLTVIYNIYKAANQNIKMISEELCNTKDWRNDAENSALYHRNKHITIENCFFKL